MPVIETLGTATRWLQLAVSVALVGTCAILLLAGRSDRLTARAWEERMVAWSRRLVLLALGSGIGVLACQTARVSGRAEAALDAGAIARVLLDTEAGRVWVVRHGLLLLLAAFVAVRADVGQRIDWLASRGEMVALGLGALVLAAATGHAAAVTPDAFAAVTVDALHLVATGLWAGGLLPLAALLRAAAREEGADARPYAVVAARRFSRSALAAVLVLVASGLVNTTIHVGSIPALVGTPYGRLLLLKVALIVPLLALAALNRRRLPALSGEAVGVGRPAMRRLARFVVGEAALVLLVLGVVAVMTLTPPARHVEPTWPFPFRLSLGGLAPDAATRALAGSQVALLGVVGIVSALILGSRRPLLLAGGAALLVTGLAVGLPPLAVDAYPTTYLRPTVPYQAWSIARGAALYHEHCAPCHGPSGAGDGPRAAGLPRPPADLRAPHAAQHTAGDLYGWITTGIARGGMPAFGDRLSTEDRWHLVNIVRALAAVESARRLGPTVERDRPSIVAPDFAFSVGPMGPRQLSDYRGRRIVLLALYTLPGSRPRLIQLARQYDVLALLGVEVVAVPRDADPDAIRRLGSSPRVLFPVVTEGAGDIVAAYGLLAPTPHAEFLVDRQGYLRARWASEGGAREMRLLLAEVQELNEERIVAPLPDEHVH